MTQKVQITMGDTFKRDIFEPELEFVMEEANGEVDGKHVIARVKGTFFVPDGVSRNNRFYPKDLWEGVISSADVQERLKSKRMLGTIGHDLVIDDKALRDGLISHIVTKLEIGNAGGKPQGIGEALILDTPAGRSLNTLLRAGSKLFTSSRAFGKFQGNENGVPKVDKNSYKFDTFDFVLDPGFIEANPKLVEGLEISNTISGNKGENKMDNDFLEKVVKQSASLQTDLAKAISMKEDLQSDHDAVKAENDDLKKKLSDMELKMKEVSDKVVTHEATLASYTKLGSAKEIEEASVAHKAKLESFEALGSLEKVTEALTRAGELLTQYKVLGTPAEVDKALVESTKTLKQYIELGTPKQVNEALDKAIETIGKYKEFGSVAELAKVFEKMEKMATNMKNEGITKKVKELAGELHVTDETVRKLLEKGLTDEEIRNVMKNVTESAQISTKYKKESVLKTNENKPANTPKAPLNESASPLFQSRVQRIMGGFGSK